METFIKIMAFAADVFSEINKNDLALFLHNKSVLVLFKLIYIYIYIFNIYLLPTCICLLYINNLGKYLLRKSNSTAVYVL